MEVGKKRVSEKSEELRREMECGSMLLLLSVLFPGDTILEVKSERVKYVPVGKVVEAITRVPSDSSEMSVRPIYH